MTRAASTPAKADPHTLPCRNRTRYKSLDSARNHWRCTAKGQVPEECEACGGFHLRAPAATGAKP